MSNDRGRLLGLEFGRFIAALLVACFHFSVAFKNMRHVAILDWAFRGGHAGVEYFFVLSGFIIFKIHRDDLGRPDKLRSFAMKRCIRIYPMFWIVFALTLLGLVFVPGPKSVSHEIAFPNIVLDGLLLPKFGDSVLGTSWSLRHELVFYSFFACAIWKGRSGLRLLLAWQLACLVIGSIFANHMPQIVRPIFYIYNIGFGMGMGAAWLTDKWLPSRPGTIAMAGIAGFTLCLAIEHEIGRFIIPPAQPLGEITSPLLYLTCSAFIVFGVTQYEKLHTLWAGSFVERLGASSYVLYLIHVPMASVMIRLFSRSRFVAISNPILFLMMVITVILMSLLIHEFIERPILRRLRSALMPSVTAPSMAIVTG